MHLKAKTPLGWVVRGCLGLLALGGVGSCMLIVLIGVLGTLGTRVEPAASVQSGRTPVAAGFILEATAPPRATSAPAATAAPTASASEPVVAEQLDSSNVGVALYLLEAAPAMQTMADGLIEIGALMQSPALTDEWKVDVAAQIVAIQQADQALRQMTDVPPEASAFHAALLDATGDCATSTEYLTSGIDTLDVDDLASAATYMQSCSEKVTEVSALMEELGQE